MSLTASEYAAWWGAVVATITGAWNIYKSITSGARIKVKAQPEMQVFPEMPPYGKTIFIRLEAVNVGTTPTKITNVIGYFPIKRTCLGKYKKQNFVFPLQDARYGGQVHQTLNPGDDWYHLIPQREIQKNSPLGMVYIGLCHNQSEKPIYVRVDFKEDLEEESDPDT